MSYGYIYPFSFTYLYSTNCSRPNLLMYATFYANIFLFPSVKLSSSFSDIPRFIPNVLNLFFKLKYVL